MKERKADDPTPPFAPEMRTPEQTWLQDEDPLAEALRIDDLRSDYCERLEARIACLTAEVEALREKLRIREEQDQRSSLDQNAS